MGLMGVVLGCGFKDMGFVVNGELEFEVVVIMSGLLSVNDDGYGCFSNIDVGCFEGGDVESCI